MASTNKTTIYLTDNKNLLDDGLPIEFEMDKMLEETNRLNNLVNNINEQTEKEINRLQRVLETFTMSPLDVPNNNNNKYLTGQTCLNKNWGSTCKLKFKVINRIAKQFLNKKIKKKRDFCLLQQEMQRPMLTELDEFPNDSFDFSMPYEFQSGASTPTISKPDSSNLFKYEMDQMESIISEPLNRNRHTDVKYLLLNKFSNSARNMDYTGGDPESPLFFKFNSSKIRSLRGRVYPLPRAHFINHNINEKLAHLELVSHSNSL